MNFLFTFLIFQIFDEKSEVGGFLEVFSPRSTFDVDCDIPYKINKDITPIPQQRKPSILDFTHFSVSRNVKQ